MIEIEILWLKTITCTVYMYCFGRALWGFQGQYGTPGLKITTPLAWRFLGSLNVGQIAQKALEKNKFFLIVKCKW